LRSRFVVVGRERGQQLKDVAQLDCWDRDGSRVSPPARRAPFSTGITENQGTTFAVRFLTVQHLLSNDQLARPMVITAASA
jgi:hypothetical protein